MTGEIMTTLIQNGLIANAASLGVHWIYDHILLEKLSQTQSLLFLFQQKALYDNASSAYYAYPYQVLGDVSFQGHICLWLYQALQMKPDFSVVDYDHLMYKHIQLDGIYDGYIESYAKKQISYLLSKKTQQPLEIQDKNDDHLVGFMPYLACKSLGLSSEKAFELTNLYSEDTLYLSYFHMFDQLLVYLSTQPRKKAIEKAITFAPKSVLETLYKATQIEDTNLFIKNYAGRACAIKYSIPVIMHVLYHQNSFDEALEKNAIIGGSVADRATIIGAIYGAIDSIPKLYFQKLSMDNV